MNLSDLEGMVTINVNEPPIVISGACRAAGERDYKRLPHEFARQFADSTVSFHYRNTAGLRLRFRTDSSRIVLNCVLPEVSLMSHMALTGSSCFDLYADGAYCGAFRPEIGLFGEYCSGTMGPHGFRSGHCFPDRRMREILIHFPLYNNVDEVELAIEADAVLLPPPPYRYPNPVVYYGSSITQGGCASHPGNCYPAMLSRRLGCDHINLGFSAGCNGEPAMADYIASLRPSVFVYDYDHNAPSAAALATTHEPFFLRLREQCPVLPVLMVSAADLTFGEAARDERCAVIRKTYENALARGDHHVAFIDGRAIYASVGASECTVDGTHPNDIGFRCMADAIEPRLSAALKGEI